MAISSLKATGNNDMVQFARLDQHSKKFRQLAADLADLLVSDDNTETKEISALATDLKKLSIIPIHELNRVLGDLKIDMTAVSIRLNAPRLLGPNVTENKLAEFIKKYLEMTRAAIELYRMAETLNGNG